MFKGFAEIILRNVTKFAKREIIQIRYTLYMSKM